MHMIMPLRRRRPVSMPPQLAPLFGAPFMGSPAPAMPSMATDISSTDEGLQFTMELPGFTKDDVTLELKEGYLIVNASLEKSSDECSCDQPEQPESEAQSAPEAKAEGEQSEACEPQPKQSWVRRERFYGSCTRSFYVGEDIEEDAITAKFENGLLKVSVPKKAELPQPEQKKLIEIQG